MITVTKQVVFGGQARAAGSIVSMHTVTKQVVFARSAWGRKRLAEKPAVETPLPPGRVPRFSRVMAWRSSLTACFGMGW